MVQEIILLLTSPGLILSSRLDYFTLKQLCKILNLNAIKLRPKVGWPSFQFIQDSPGRNY